MNRRTRLFVIAPVLAAMFAAGLPAIAHDRPSYDRSRDSRNSRDRDHRHDDHVHGHWERIGVVTACHENESDLIDLGEGGRRYNAVMFRVTRGNAYIEHFKLTFGDDSVYVPDIRTVFREGERTRTLDLPPGVKRIQRVRIIHRAIGREDVKIEILGLRPA